MMSFFRHFRDNEAAVVGIVRHFHYRLLPLHSLRPKQAASVSYGFVACRRANERDLHDLQIMIIIRKYENGNRLMDLYFCQIFLM